MPIMYYHVWDNFPTPYFNKYIYDSCDWIGCINKLTHEIVTEISADTPSSYIPHGVSDTAFLKYQTLNKVGIKLIYLVHLIMIL